MYRIDVYTRQNELFGVIVGSDETDWTMSRQIGNPTCFLTKYHAEKCKKWFSERALDYSFEIVEVEV